MRPHHRSHSTVPFVPDTFFREFFSVPGSLHRAPRIPHGHLDDEVVTGGIAARPTGSSDYEYSHMRGPKQAPINQSEPMVLAQLYGRIVPNDCTDIIVGFRKAPPGGGRELQANGGLESWGLCPLKLRCPWSAARVCHCLSLANGFLREVESKTRPA